MTIRVYNTLTREKTDFQTVAPNQVGMYVCGPTVYKPSHLGHMVGPVIFDTVKRYLTYSGYQVKLVVNITDVDDKLIVEAKKQNTTVKELAERVTADYCKALGQLNVTGIDHMPRATEHIGGIIEMIQGLITRDYAYPAGGDVYFNVGKDEDYGKLCHRDPTQLEAGARIEVSDKKRNPGDFAMWKAAKPGEPQWDDANWTAPEFAREFERVGVAAVIIHGRTREQGFGGSVKLDGIRAVVEAVDRMPVIGNGDVCTIADVERMFSYTGCAGISIGRGALLNPWIFAQLERWERTGDPGEPASYEDRLNLMARHFHLLVDQRGDHFACLSFRKVANWYCKVLKPGREIQQTLVRIDSVVVFDEIVRGLFERGEPEHWRKWGVGVEQIAVPRGPVSHW